GGGVAQGLGGGRDGLPRGERAQDGEAMVEHGDTFVAEGRLRSRCSESTTAGGAAQGGVRRRASPWVATHARAGGLGVAGSGHGWEEEQGERRLQRGGARRDEGARRRAAGGGRRRQRDGEEEAGCQGVCG